MCCTVLTVCYHLGLKLTNCGVKVKEKFSVTDSRFTVETHY